MAKQTLFEAEAILSANTAGMLRDIDQAVQQAQARLNSLNGSVNFWNNQGGGGGGGRGGSGSSSLWNHYYKEEMLLVAAARSAGKYEEALNKLNAMKRNSMYSDLQRLQVQKLIVDTENQGNRAREQFGKKGVAFDAKQERERAQEIKKSARETQNLVNAQVRAAISASQFDDAIRIQTQHLNSLKVGTTEYYNNLAKLQNLQNTVQSMGNPAARQRNAMIQNLSFGIQDFAVVMSMGGGLGRGLAAASNNLAFMASMMGTVQGAAIGLGLTLVAVFLPSIAKAATGIRDVGESADEAAAALDRLRAARERAGGEIEIKNRVENEVGGNVFGKPQQDRINDLRDQLSVEEAKLKSTQDSIEMQRIEVARALREGTGDAPAAWQFFTPGSTASNAYRNFNADALLAGEGKLTADDLRKKADELPMTAKWVTDVEERYRALADRMDELSKPAIESGDNIRDLTNEITLMEEETKKRGEEIRNLVGGALIPFGPALGSMTMTPDDKIKWQQQRDRDAKEKANDARQLEMRGLRDKVSAGESLYETLFPKEDAIAKIKKQYEDLFGGGFFGGVNDPDVQAMMNAQIAQIKNPRESITGTMGGSEFASQLTNQLLKSDPQEKLLAEAAKHTGLQERIAKATEAARTRLESLETTPFRDN